MNDFPIREILENTVFTLDDIILEGVECVAFTTKDVVFKIPRYREGPMLHTFVKGYRTAMKHIPDSIPLTVEVPDVTITYESFEGTKQGIVTQDFLFCFVQKEVLGLEEFFQACSDDEKKKEVAQNIAFADNTILSKGVYVPDDYMKNKGLDAYDNVVLLDLGAVTSDLSATVRGVWDACFMNQSLLGKNQRMNKKGHVLYTTLAYLRAYHGDIVADAYREATGLDFSGEVRLRLSHRELEEAIPTFQKEISRAMELFYGTDTYIGLRGKGESEQDLFRRIVAQDSIAGDIIRTTIIRNRYAREFFEITEQQLRKYFNPIVD